jgi:hypothetical protein
MIQSEETSSSEFGCGLSNPLADRIIASCLASKPASKSGPLILTPKPSILCGNTTLTSVL